MVKSVEQLAREARGMVEAQEELDALKVDLGKRKAREKARHAAELKKIAAFQKEVIDPVMRRVRVASAAMGEITAQHIPRELVTAESVARSLVSRMRREVDVRRVDIDKAKEAIKAKGKPGEELKRNLERAESELAEFRDSLEAALAQWELARGQLDRAISEILNTSAEAK